MKDKRSSPNQNDAIASNAAGRLTISETFNVNGRFLELSFFRRARSGKITCLTKSAGLAITPAGVIAKPALLVRQVIFPDLARLKNESSKNLPLTLKVSLIVSLPAALLAIASFWFGEDLLSFTVGEDYTIAIV